MKICKKTTQTKKKKIIIVPYDMIVDMLSNEKLNPIIKNCLSRVEN